MPADEQITLVVDAKDVEDVLGRLREGMAAEGRMKREAADVSAVVGANEEETRELQRVSLMAIGAAKEAKMEVAELEPEGEKIKGMNLLVRRTVAQLPGIREGYRVLMLMRTMLRVSPEIALILAAWMAGQAFMDWLGGQAKEAEEYRKMIIEARGITTRAQFEAWQVEERRQADSLSRSGVVQ